MPHKPATDLLSFHAPHNVHDVAPPQSPCLGRNSDTSVLRASTADGAPSSTPKIIAQMSGLKRILGEESAVSVAHKKRKGRQRQQQLVERSCEECYTMFATYLEPWRSLHLAKTERYQLKISHMKIKATRQCRHPCPTCCLLLSILRGADGLILAQTDPSDLSLRYDENGVTDSDDLPDARFKAKRAKENVKTELRLSYAHGERKIRLDFLISLRSPFSTSLSDEIEVQEQLIVLNNVGTCKKLG